MTDKTPPKLIKLYKDMYDLTLPECKKSCRAPLRCCSPEYCDFTMDFAARRGVQLEKTSHPHLPLMGPSGCTAPPHLRPMCTLHTCDVQSLGFKRPPEDGSPPTEANRWNTEYYELRSKIEQEELLLMGHRLDL